MAFEMAVMDGGRFSQVHQVYILSSSVRAVCRIFNLAVKFFTNVEIKAFPYILPFFHEMNANLR